MSDFLLGTLYAVVTGYIAFKFFQDRMLVKGTFMSIGCLAFSILSVSSTGAITEEFVKLAYLVLVGAIGPAILIAGALEGKTREDRLINVSFGILMSIITVSVGWAAFLLELKNPL